MKIVIFGASGLTGHQLLEQGLRQGFEITAFVRDPSKLRIKHKNLNYVVGDVGNKDQVMDAVKGQDAALSALGASTPLKRNFILIEGIRNIVSSMEQQNVKRFVYESFLGVRENRAELGFFVNNIVSVFLKNVIADHEEKERIIRNSALDWTIVRAPKLTNGPYTGKYRIGEHIVSSSLILKVSRADVADLMLRLVRSGEYVRQAPRLLH
jgi:putative NADH-flavin reductase